MKINLLQNISANENSQPVFPGPSGVLALAARYRCVTRRRCLSLPPAKQKFDSPEAAVAALTEAAKAKDTNAVHAIFGPEGQELISPDVVQASEGFNHFVKRLSEKTNS